MAPQQGWRAVQVTARRRSEDFADALRELAAAWPEAERIVLVLDNLNTHTPAALYRTFPAAEAFAIWQRFEVHYTPKHGSWLNQAELELSVLQRQCLHRRIPDPETLRQEIEAWVAERNAAAIPIRWSFTVEAARARLPRVYPVPEQDRIA